MPPCLGLKKMEKKKKMIEDFADMGDRRLSLVKFLLKIIFELTSYRRVSPILRILQRPTYINENPCLNQFDPKPQYLHKIIYLSKNANIKIYFSK